MHPFVESLSKHVKSSVDITEASALAKTEASTAAALLAITDGTTALIAPEGESYSRVGDADTGDNSADFALLPITPGTGD